MKWRNEQIDILRQKEQLTPEMQDHYFKNVVSGLFEQERPRQLLFSFLERDVFTGYGGLVHIDWESGNGEISFLTATEKNSNPDQFKSDWKVYLKLLKQIAKMNLGFNKIYTYAYDIRPYLFEALMESGFSEEARLKEHVSINGRLYDVLIHSFFFDKISLRIADENDVQLMFEWANDEDVRKNAFNQSKIDIEHHRKWFAAKLSDLNSLIFIASIHQKDIGQIRFDKKEGNSFEIDFSIVRDARGKGIGASLIKEGTAEFFKKKPSAARVIGKVKKNNFASNNSFINAGFLEMKNGKHDPDVNIYYKDSVH